MQPDNLNHDSRTRPIAKMDVERAMLEQANYQTVALKAIADSVGRIAAMIEDIASAMVIDPDSDAFMQDQIGSVIGPQINQE